jgi:trk system potassium uptake protein TrkA
MKIIVVGGARVVYFLCRAFLSKGHSVTLINRDREECTALARRLKATVVHGDGSDPDILAEAGADTSDAVLAVTPNDEDNLVICEIAERRFGVPRTLALVNDPDNEEVFRTLGRTTAFSTTHIIANLIEQRAGFEQISNLLPIGEGKITVTEVKLSPGAPVAGKSLQEIGLPEDALIAGVLRDGEAIIPRGPTVLREGDRLVLMALPDQLGAVLKRLVGETAR